MGIENPVHLIFIAAVALIVLGPRRLPELARALGNGLREFRSAISDGAEGVHEHAPTTSEPAAPAPPPSAAGPATATAAPAPPPAPAVPEPAPPAPAAPPAAAPPAAAPPAAFSGPPILPPGEVAAPAQAAPPAVGDAAGPEA